MSNLLNDLRAAIDTALGKLEKARNAQSLTDGAVGTAVDLVKSAQQAVTNAEMESSDFASSIGDNPKPSQKTMKAGYEAAVVEAKENLEAANGELEKARENNRKKNITLSNAKAAVTKAEDALEAAEKDADVDAEVAPPEPEPEPEDKEESTDDPETDPESDSEPAEESVESDSPNSNRSESNNSWLTWFAVLALAFIIMFFMLMDTRSDNSAQDVIISGHSTDIGALRTDVDANAKAIVANSEADAKSDREREDERYWLQRTANRANLATIRAMGYDEKAAWKLMNEVALDWSNEKWAEIKAGAPDHIDKRVSANTSAIANIDSLVHDQAAFADDVMKQFTTPDISKLEKELAELQAAMVKIKKSASKKELTDLQAKINKVEKDVATVQKVVLKHHKKK